MIKTNDTTTSRRTLLARLPAVAAAALAGATAINAVVVASSRPAGAFQAPAIAPEAVVPDPIFAVIERHRQALQIYEKAHELFEKHSDDPSCGPMAVIVGQRPRSKLVGMSLDENGMPSFQYEPTNEMEPIVAHTRAQIVGAAPADLDGVERVRWIDRHYRKMLRDHRIEKAKYENSPRSLAYDSWNEADEVVNAISAELRSTVTPTTAAGIAGALAYWADVMDTGDSEDENHDRDAISTVEFIKHMAKAAAALHTA